MTSRTTALFHENSGIPQEFWNSTSVLAMLHFGQKYLYTYTFLPNSMTFTLLQNPLNPKAGVSAASMLLCFRGG